MVAHLLGNPGLLTDGTRQSLLGKWVAVLLVAIVISMGMRLGIASTALAPQSQPDSDPLLAEVRALRADLPQAAGASIRARLLVARLGQDTTGRIRIGCGYLA